MAARMALLPQRSLPWFQRTRSLRELAVFQQAPIGANQPLRTVPRADEVRLNSPLRYRQRTARSSSGHGAPPRFGDALPNGPGASSGARAVPGPPRGARSARAPRGLTHPPPAKTKWGRKARAVFGLRIAIWWPTPRAPVQ